MRPDEKALPAGSARVYAAGVIAIAREALAACCALTTVLAGAHAWAEEGLDPRIVNGVLAWEPPSVGAWLCGAIPCLPEDGDPVPDPHLIVDCSGTLIGCRTFVTAGHCVCHLLNATSCHETIPRDPSTHRVFLQHAGVFAVESIRVHPDYNYVTGNADVAVVKLAEPVPGVSPAVLNDLGTPPFGTPGTIVGFGQGESGPVGPTRGIKRSGSVITADCQPGISNEGHICWNYEEPLGPPGSDSNTCFGDSGGALFVDLGGGAVLAGVTHGGNSGFCGPPEVGNDQDVYWQRDFIVGEAGADLGTTCGDVAPVGHPRTVASKFSGTLSGGKVEDLHEFDVAAGMALLRVTLNAQPKGGASDFDLYLKAGAPPTPSDFDCAAADPSQFGSCEIPSPAPGTWHMLVERVAGDGDYQVTAVAAPEPSEVLLLAAGALVLAAATLLREFHFGRLD